MELEELPKKISDDVEIRYLFEQRKRKEIDRLLQRGMRVKTSLSKSSLMKQSYSTASQLGGGKITPIHRRLVTPSKGSIKKRSVGRISIAKTEVGKKSPFISNPYYKTAGIKKPFYTQSELDFEPLISIFEMLEIPEFYPDPKQARILRPIPLFMMQFRARLNYMIPLEGKENGPHDFSFKKQKKESFDEDALPEEVYLDEIQIEEEKTIDIECIKDGIEKGLMKWNQLLFDRACLTHLERNIHLLD